MQFALVSVLFAVGVFAKNGCGFPDGPDCVSLGKGSDGLEVFRDNDGCCLLLPVAVMKPALNVVARTRAPMVYRSTQRGLRTVAGLRRTTGHRSSDGEEQRDG
ncbi:hypothetical protein NW765_001694 [Fusarium oxysporum]|nr:hypothetical protein NW765_001694 [Fusarium oxysporum]